ncbi:MAG TPA: class IV adenylate cyclase [Candidatus Paceibacterota bacterium]|nr:class IV adenylate cyclase [Candidatus Paceibacterota bacterium]
MEIEVKARLKNVAETLAKLEALGCVFSDPKTQDDLMFVEKPGGVEEIISNDVFARIRIENGSKVVLTIKKPISKVADVLVKHEHEVVVDSAEEARGMLELLGLKESVRVVKTRRTGHYGAYEICIDDVADLGSFIEVEIMGEQEDAQELQNKMWEFLASLGIAPHDQVTRGYDLLMAAAQSA